VGKLREYQRKRSFEATPEPAGGPSLPSPQAGRDEKPRFVVQEHHARRLHWDFRLERDGALVSWAVPRGVPADPKRNHLAVHVEDHPLEYIDFAGEIPKGNYGAGKVSLWDQGTYETLKWEPDEVMVVLHGKRLQGRYVLFSTRGQDWMIHRMDPPSDPGRQPMPEKVVPMLARLSRVLPAPDAAYGYEFKWDGIRAVLYVQGGRVTLQSRNLEDISHRYPELRGLGAELGTREAVLDGEVVALDAAGRPSFEQLQQRMGLNSEADIRRQMKQVPLLYMAFDLLYDDGRNLIGVPYSERRERLEAIKLNGRNWLTPPYSAGGGEAMLEASRQQRLEGVMAKKLDSPYEPGQRSGAWLKVKNHEDQEFVIGGYVEGEGRRKGQVGALLVGYQKDGEFVYAGKVGTGFSDRTLDQLDRLLKPLERPSSPFTRGASPPRAAHFVEPKLVGLFEFAEWTRGGQLRAPAFKCLRDGRPGGDA